MGFAMPLTALSQRNAMSRVPRVSGPSPPRIFAAGLGMG
jgi:hypothetical protein